MRALILELCRWIDRLFPDVERGERLKTALQAHFGDDSRPVTGDVCREIEAVAHELSRHFALEYVDGGTLLPDAEPPGWPAEDPREVSSRAGSVQEVTRVDGVGVLALDGLNKVELAAPYLEAAEGTFSSGEALAYHAQSRGRARLVGARTPGAADHVTPVRVTSHVRAILPEARVVDAVTGTSWEGQGVVPDIPCESVDALRVALDA